MKKIIHLSDIHIGFKNLAQRFRSIVNSIIFLKEPASDYVIVLTGDIVESARVEWNYQEAGRQIELLREAGFEVLVSPGNHDYGTGSLGSKAHVPTFKKTFFGQTDVEYPKVDIIDQTAFIGLDSMAEELHWYDRLFANGEIGGPQLERLEASLKSDHVGACQYTVVYLHHHPFDPWVGHELKDSEALGEVLRNARVDALLYGHNHMGKSRHGKWGIRRCYDAGTGTHKEGKAGHHWVINLSELPLLDYDADFDWEV